MNPEGNNNQSASTTVGGVTFGSGSGSAAPAKDTTNGSQSQPQTQAPQKSEAPKNGVDPIVDSTGEEFDAVMNAAGQEYDKSPIPNTFNTQISSPTHFDTQNTVKPMVVDPGIPGGFSRQQMQKEEPVDDIPTQLTKQVKKASTVAVIFGILTAVFTILAVVGLVFALNSQTEIADLKKEVANQQTIIKTVEETTGVSPIDSPEKVPVYKATTGYIYISEWNIKIQLDATLDHISYILNNINYHQSICFNAVGKGVQQFPDFANVALNPGKMGCLTRIKTSEGSFDATTGISYGEKVATFKEYSYFYTGATIYSTTADMLNLENTAVQSIHNMLRDNVSEYE